jgi:predicted transcriptional regulator
MHQTYLTTDQLSERLHYDARTIRNQLVDNCLIEGRHYVRPFGRRKYLFIWEAIEADILSSGKDTIAMPMAA